MGMLINSKPWSQQSRFRHEPGLDRELPFLPHQWTASRMQHLQERNRGRVRLDLIQHPLPGNLSRLAFDRNRFDPPVSGKRCHSCNKLDLGELPVDAITCTLRTGEKVPPPRRYEFSITQGLCEGPTPAGRADKLRGPPFEAVAAPILGVRLQVGRTRGNHCLQGQHNCLASNGGRLRQVPVDNFGCRDRRIKAQSLVHDGKTANVGLITKAHEH